MPDTATGALVRSYHDSEHTTDGTSDGGRLAPAFRGTPSLPIKVRAWGLLLVGYHVVVMRDVTAVYYESVKSDPRRPALGGSNVAR